ncbi:UDP-N-acetylglucosamine 2-epimerase (non-hydrolyzing) [Roseibacterium sp. SDUM158017]|uniref:non-hydrolyzing UDP-N-acetylglucosamine 2-epimerase n=1 Tax=Roseicyclus salinarum TaxID=3036773 RepID=UPI0024157ED6|nr:UDP-N-acetylglucosamine 2-epimerase (non-hydrolyzing) [Roseibacterium sp. SDUM158017]MDG4647141.1 UDP-N-acetylglucosamine 2-epimerase (non-hydrolyzing) [Roseibacterium sp. SDUM158017]
MRVCTVLGARPQFIKSSAVSKAYVQRAGVEEVIIHTGQHFDANMSDVFFEELGIPRPKYNLGISGLSHGAMTGRMLEALEETFESEKPDWVVVYGDTNSTIAAALAASKLQIPLAHVEAGLRSFNRQMPEEINRILTDHCSDLLFTPTDVATKNLLNEGVAPQKILQVGDVMQDATLLFGEAADRHAGILSELGVTTKGYVLATVHRQENTDHPERLSAILDGLSGVSSELPVVLPLHPRTLSRMSKQGLSIGPGIIAVDPLGYLDMLVLERNAAAIVTDSGGVQKEAYFQRVPCVTLRDETEWTELVDTGWNCICPPVSAVEIAQTVLDRVSTVGQDVALYGDGSASARIVERILSS